MQEELLKIIDKFHMERGTSISIPRGLINDLSKYEKVYIISKLGLELDHYGNVINVNNLCSNNYNRVYKIKKKKRN